MEKTDAELIHQVLHEDPDSFRFLVQRYERPLLAYLHHRLGNRDRAREAAQETFVRAYFNLSKLEKPGALHSWLFGIASRVTLELYRSRERTMATAEDIDQLPPPPVEMPEECRLDEAIAALPEGQRQVIMLRYYEEWSCQEIADRLKMPLGSVTKTLSRAYVSLRGELVKAAPSQKEE
jgi:RNA polymerase sigma-70 factor (ECF subfamily)